LENVLQADNNMLDPPTALKDGARMIEQSRVLLGMDPNNVTSLNNTGVAEQSVSDTFWSNGQLRESIAHSLKALDYYGQASRGGAGMNITRAANMANAAALQAQVGDFAGAAATLATNGPYLAAVQKRKSDDQFVPFMIASLGRWPTATIAEQQDNPALARRISLDLDTQMAAFKPKGGLEIEYTSIGRYKVAHIGAKAAYRLEDYAAAEKLEREALVNRRVWGTKATSDLRDLGELSTWLAMAVARQGRTAEAEALIEPVVKFQRELATRNHGDKWLPLELAWALYARSLAEPAHAAEARAEATRLIAGLAPEIAHLHDTRNLQSWLKAAERKPG
jgi:hypothetical protein